MIIAFPVGRFLNKLQIELSNDPAILVLGSSYMKTSTPNNQGYFFERAGHKLR